MLVSFEELSENARVWIYQADKELSSEETEAVENKAKAFCEEWAAHGAPMKCSAKIFHNRFLVLAADEDYTKASGCSIDSSVHMVQELEQQFGISLFDRTKVAFLLNDEIYVESLNKLKESVQEGVIGKETITFNNTVSNKKELESAWKVPAESTWMSRYF
ncbi:hypothetical protein LVD15_07970 [Fulvivirga maritima]|uniref:hypothetical protein n=1 Tax=Fulvivirga maritima TaxID=2904247 RepID=UPI001F40C968|nr:hypothetical protein [Fulvivirga maritima]UII28355.1 hypothetical protein LVD15_07970 [Fulvivirga maritima]